MSKAIPAPPVSALKPLTDDELTKVVGGAKSPIAKLLKIKFGCGCSKPGAHY